MPPVYFVVALAAMVALRFALPVAKFGNAALDAVGGVLVAAGLVLEVWGSRLFDRARTTIKPFQESSTLVTHGPFRISRNPMYLGMVVILLVVGLLLGSLLPFLVVPIFRLLIERRFIRFEEAGLERTFGAEYSAYKARVRRWV